MQAAAISSVVLTFQPVSAVLLAMVLVDEDLQPVNGGARPNPGVRFHLWIYRKRPDVRAIVHTHGPFSAALRWAELSGVTLRYFSTRKDREKGWMQLILKGSGRAADARGR